MGGGMDGYIWDVYESMYIMWMWGSGECKGLGNAAKPNKKNPDLSVKVRGRML